MGRRKMVALFLGLALLMSGFASAQAQFDNVEYTMPASPGQKKGDTYKGTLKFDSTDKEVQFVSKGGSVPLRVKYEVIKSMLYERSAKPRYALGLLVAWPLLFTKSKKHWLTIQYTDPTGTGQFALLRLDKGNYREVLASAEAETGKKLERTEER
jgi:hypothetical protein